MGNIEEILVELGLENSCTYWKVLGGEDSAVWKISQQDGTSFALRILPAERIGQFLEEEIKIKLAVEAGIQVPDIRAIKVIGESAIMLMEWANGVPVLEQLMKHPDTARVVGVEYGKVQAAIHQVKVPDEYANRRSWMTPVTPDELKIVGMISEKYDLQNSLIHLDYHPLNVLTDGEKITAVIDWVNAGAADPRYDLARTFATLQLEGTRPGSGLEEYVSVFKTFEEGWTEGYRLVAGSFEIPNLFKAYAGIRMIRDLEGKREEAEFDRIKAWVNNLIEL